MLAVILLFLLCSGHGAAHAGPPDEASEEQAAAVEMDGKILFYVAGIRVYPAERRAQEIGDRIKALARETAFDPSTLQVREEDGVHVIFTADQKLVLTVLPADLKSNGLMTTHPGFAAREIYLKKIAEAVQSYRSARTSGNLLKSGLHALLRTVCLVLLMFVVFWCFRKLEALLERHVRRKIENLEAKSHFLLRSQQIWSALKGALRIARALFAIALVYVFLNFVLSLFPWTHYAAQTLLDYVTNPLLIMWRALVDYLPNIFFLVVLTFIVRYLLKLMRIFFDGVDRGQLSFTGFDADWAWPTYRIVRGLVILLSMVVAYPYVPGSQSEAFKGISLMVGVLLSLGSTSMTSNILAGYSLTYRRAFKVGDRVKVGSNIGDVEQIRLLVTNLRSLKNEMIVIPNSFILNNEIINFSALAAKQGLILHTTVGIGYEVPWRQVASMLLLAAVRTPGLLPTPKPFVLQTGLGDFAITYELNVYCAEPKEMLALYSLLHSNIQDVFNEHNVQIMTPHYVQDTQEPKVVPRERWHIPPAPAPQDPGKTAPYSAKVETV
ncbi:MAG: hypothetical protein VR64_21555 [Desulfatitalea sp. BRH_c12]|nr:MAG: hypothetical protein VR64_21555 [Desulfatitalea sp. BRH_c12]